MTNTLKPGLLVALHSAIRGGVQYTREDLAAPEAAEGEATSRWETTRVIENVDEHELAVRTRSKATGLIRRECLKTGHGLLCLTANEVELDRAISDARGMVRDFNNGSRSCEIRVNVVKGRIAETDEEATRAIATEVRDLLEDMETGIRSLDPKKIRDAANAARQVGAMLSGSDSEKLGDAIKTARKAAREIVSRVEKAGTPAESFVLETVTKPLDDARFAFLDMDEAPAVEGEQMPPVPAAAFDVDMEPEGDDEEPEEGQPEGAFEPDDEEEEAGPLSFAAMLESNPNPTTTIPEEAPQELDFSQMGREDS